MALLKEVRLPPSSNGSVPPLHSVAVFPAGVIAMRPGTTTTRRLKTIAGHRSVHAQAAGRGEPPTPQATGGSAVQIMSIPTVLVAKTFTPTIKRRHRVGTSGNHPCCRARLGQVRPDRSSRRNQKLAGPDDQSQSLSVTEARPFNLTSMSAAHGTCERLTIRRAHLPHASAITG